MIIKTVLSKEGVKKILNSHDLENIKTIAVIKINHHFNDPKSLVFGCSFIYTMALIDIEELLNDEDTMFLRFEVVDEKKPTENHAVKTGEVEIIEL